jgi:murein DD-endopeptidase MepM/ murein hydrolase activator NlpD
VRSTGYGRGARPGAITFLAIAAVLLACSAALAAVGGAPAPAASPPRPGSNPGAPSPEPSAGVIGLTTAVTKPSKSFYFGFRHPRLRYAITSTQPQNDIQIEIVDAAGAIVRTFYRQDIAPGVTYGVRWDGTAADGRPARNGKFSFRISPQVPLVPAARKRTTTTPGLGFSRFGFAFPVLGDHAYNLSSGRFGAARSGHTHQGQDIGASCGTPVLAARGGRVQFSGWQDAAGHYLVIDGRGTLDDFVYMHLAEAPLPEVGDTVHTGQPISAVGDSGNATGCLLHFEIWSAPGWYEGGSPFDPLTELQRWDRYS